MLNNHLDPENQKQHQFREIYPGLDVQMVLWFVRLILKNRILFSLWYFYQVISVKSQKQFFFKITKQHITILLHDRGSNNRFGESKH